MAEDLSVVGIKFDTSGVDRGAESLDKLAGKGDKVDAAIGKVDGAAKKAGKSLESMGQGADASVAATERLAQSGQKLGSVFAEASKAMSTGQVGQAMAQSAAATAAVNEQLRNSADGAKQLAYQMRQVAPQVTDIVTGLASGQAPLTVLIQQGGQLKDVFGGVGPAARAIGGYVAGLVNPFSVAAVAAVALGAAFFKGASEATTLQRAIALSGGAAGVTTDQLVVMSRALSSVTGSQSAAVGALAEFARVGGIGKESLSQFTESALRFEKVTGQSVKETAKAFEQLSKAPFESALKLNEAVNFLTDSTVKQIAALERNGNAAQATKLAQEELARAQDRVSATMVSSAGVIERAWDGVANSVRKVISAIAAVGREPTLREKANSLGNQISALEASGAGKDGKGGAFGRFQGDSDQLELLRQQRTAFLEMAAAAEQSALAQEVAAERTKRRAAFERDFTADLDKSKKAQIEQRKVTDLLTEGIINQSEAETRRAQITEKYLKGDIAKAEAEAKKAERERLKDLEEQRKAMAAALGVTNDYVETLGRYQRLREAGSISEEAYLRAIEELIRKQPSSIALTKEAADASKRQAEEYERLSRLATARAETMDRESEGLLKTVEALEFEVKYLGLSNEQKERAIFLDKTRASLNSGSISTAEFDDLRRRFDIAAATVADRKALDAMNAQYKSAMDKAATDSQAVWQRTNDEINRGLTDSLFRAAEAGKDFFQTLRDSLVGMFNNLILRPVIQAIFSPISGTISSLIGTGTGQGGVAGGTGLLGSITSSIASLLGPSAAASAASGVTGASALVIGAAPGQLASAAGGLSGALAAIPVWGWAALGAAAVAAVLSQDRGGPKGGGSYSTNGARLFTPDTADASLLSIGNASALSMSQLARRYGGSAAGLQFGIGYDTDPQGKADNRIASFLRDAQGRSILDNVAGRAVGRDDATLQAELALESKRVLLAALQASDLQNGFDEVFKRLNPGAAGVEAIDALFTLADQLRGVGEAAKDLPGVMGSVANLSATAREQLLGLAGGLDALNAAQGTYYSEFFSAQEQIANSQRVLTGRFSDIGLSFEQITSATGGARAGFRSVVEALDLQTEAGRQSYASLIALAGPLDQYLDALDSQKTAAEEAASASNTASQALQAQIDAMAATFGDLEGAMKEIAPAAATLVDAWRANKAEIEALKAALGQGGASGTAGLIAGFQASQGALANVQSARAGIQDRILDAQLRSMDPSAQIATLREREAALWSQVGGSGDQVGLLAKIEQTVLRRLGIEGQAGASAQQAGFDAQFSAAQEAQRLAKAAREDQIGVLEAQRSAAQEQIKALERQRDFSRQIADFSAGLRVGELSILSPEQRIAAAGGAFRQNVAGAQAGDQFAMSALQGSASEYLQLTKQFFGSTANYVAAFSEVTGALDALGAAGTGADAQMQLLRQQADGISSQVDILRAIEDQNIELQKATIDTSAAEVAALQMIDAAFAANESALTVSIDGMRATLERLLAIAEADRAAQEAAIAREVQHQRDLIAAQAAIAANTAATADNTAGLALSNIPPSVVTA